MRLSNIALAITALYGGFSPLRLFANGEQGFFYDPSDLSTLFQDSAGTTPVTGVEQVVGLMLDKSKGLVLGAELVTNGDFSGGTTGWTAYQSTLSVVGGKLRATALSASPGSSQPVSVVSGKTYEVTFEIDVGTVGGGSYFVGNTLFGGIFSIPSSGTYTFNLTSGTTNAAYLFYIHRNSGASAGQYFDIDNVSIKELAGNHATASAMAKPSLSARVNLLTKTEDFGNAVWGTAVAGGASISKGTTTGVRPDGTTGTVHTLTFSAVSAGQYAFGGQVTAQAFLNVQLISSLHVRVASGTATIYLNLEDSGAPPSGTNFVAGSAQTVTTSWQRISLTGTRATAPNAVSVVIGFDTRAAAGQTNASPFTLEVWGADLRVANDGVGIPAYQRVNTATDYDSSGFPLYLRFGGTQAMSTGSIDFTATDKMSVFAGVRKLSDAATGLVAELSVEWNSNSGSFAFGAPNNTGITADYSAASKGNAAFNINQVAFSAVALAPISNVYAATHDIPGDLSAIRLNGAASGTNGTGDKGAGNFGNYPLYIGARNLASIFFNGRIYSLIGVGSAVSAGNISATESWVNGRTKAY